MKTDYDMIPIYKLKKEIDKLTAYQYTKEIDSLDKKIEKLKYSYELGRVSKKDYDSELKILENERSDYYKLSVETAVVLKSLKRELSRFDIIKMKEFVNTQLLYAVRVFNSEIYGKNKNFIFFNANKFSGKKRKISKKIYDILKYNSDKTVYSRYESIIPKTLEQVMHSYTPESGPRGLMEELTPSEKNAMREKFDPITKKADISNIRALVNESNEIYFNRYEFISSKKNKLSNFPMLYKKVVKMNNLYNEVLNISMEIVYNNELIKLVEKDYFVCEDLEIYKWLKKHNIDLSEKLKDLSSKADSMYHIVNIENKLFNISRLETLYSQIINLDKNLNSFEIKEDSLEKTLILIDLKRFVNEMNSIISNNSDLYSKEYMEFIKKYDNKYFKDKPIIASEEERKESEDFKRDNIKPTNTVIGKNDVMSENKVQSVHENNYQESDNNNEQKFYEGIDDELNKKRKHYYSKYLNEKFLDTELGKLSFSEYLKKSASYETKLIIHERLREEYARNVFKEYLKYYANIVDKKEALSFKEFGKIHFKQDMDKIDVPIEFEEQYKKMRML